MKRPFKAFWNDDDGFSAKDYLMVLLIGIYAVFLVVAFFAPFFGVTVTAISLGVIDGMGAVVMTIVGGVFAVNAVKEFRSPTVDTTPVVPEPEKKDKDEEELII